MLDPKKIQAVMTSAIDQVKTFILNHEAADHGGGLCYPSRSFAAAWFACAMGLPDSPAKAAGERFCMAMKQIRRAGK